MLSSYTSVLRQPKCNSSHRTADITVQLAHSAGSFAVGCPPPLLRILGCSSLQPGPRWGTIAHLRLRPVHKRLALGLPRFAPVPPWTGSRLSLRLRTRLGHRSTFSFLLDFSSILPLNCTLGFYSPSGSPHCDLTVCLPSVRSTAPSFLMNPYTLAHVPHTRPELSRH